MLLFIGFIKPENFPPSLLAWNKYSLVHFPGPQHLNPAKRNNKKEKCRLLFYFSKFSYLGNLLVPSINELTTLKLFCKSCF